MEYEEDLREEVFPKENKNNFYMHKSTGFKCNKCNREFTLPSNLNRHMRHNKICGFSKGFECSNCHKVFSLNATLKDHYERCIAEDPYRFPCPNCSKQFTFKSSLNKHLRGRCRTLKKKSFQPKDVLIYSCKYCAAEFYDLKICQKHEESGKCTTDKEPQPFCPHCGKTFTMKSSLTKHLKGRCKLMHHTTIKYETDNDTKTEYIFEVTSNSNEDEEYQAVEEVDETWFEHNDLVIENNGEETDETITDQVESYIEISNEAIENDEKKFTYETEEESSNEKEIAYRIILDG